MTEEVVTEQAPAAVEKPVDAPQAEPARNYEAEARASGWVPETEWKGDKKPAKFLDAQEFVERGEELAPFLKKENKRLQERLDRVVRDFDGRVEKLNRVAVTTQERLVADYERQLNEIKTAQEKAVEAGDKDEFKRLERQRGTLEANRPEEIEIEQPKGANPDDEFRKSNTWYGVDDDMTAIAMGYSQKIQRESNGAMALEDNLRKTEAYMRQKYPALYGAKPAVNGHAAVDGGGSFTAPARSDPLSKLPNEARHQAKQDMQKYPKIYPDAASWIKAYEGK